MNVSAGVRFVESSSVELCVMMQSNGLEEWIEVSSTNKVYISTKPEKKAHIGNIL